MIQLLETVHGLVWGAPTLLLILGVGLYLSLKTGMIQVGLLPRAIGGLLMQFHRKKNSGKNVSPYQALCTALAATVGTGNLAGVAGAITIGGPGAVFWMWISALLGMMTKFAEAVLSVRYRVRNSDGEWVSGPMYMISNGMGSHWKWLASIYCFFGVVASFGVGNATQINTVIGSIKSTVMSYGMDVSFGLTVIFGIILSVLITRILLGGAKRIGLIAEKLVPFAAIGYLILGALVLVFRAHAIPHAFASIIEGAFQPKAVTGGMLGSAFIALRVGTSRGVFTNEAGMGTAAIAHGSAYVNHPVEQGLMGIVEVFVDTIVICTMTALAILCSGIMIPYGTDNGIQLTIQAFCAVLGNWVSIPITVGLCCFAIATVLGWGLYGLRCAQYLFGENVWKKFVYLQAVMVVLGAVLQTDTVWMLAEIVNGLMAIPNLIALAYLSPELIFVIKTYKKESDPKAGLAYISSL